MQDYYVIARYLECYEKIQGIWRSSILSRDYEVHFAVEKNQNQYTPIGGSFRSVYHTSFRLNTRNWKFRDSLDMVGVYLEINKGQ